MAEDVRRKLENEYPVRGFGFWGGTAPGLSIQAGDLPTVARASLAGVMRRLTQECARWPPRRSRRGHEPKKESERRSSPYAWR